MGCESLNIAVGGEAGQGLVTIGQMFAKTVTRAGYELHVTQDYLSRVRGGHNSYVVRTGVEPLTGPKDDVDILIALGKQTYDIFSGKLADEAVVIIDEAEAAPIIEALGNEGCLAVPFKELASKPMFYNTAALGILAQLTGVDISLLEQLLEETFGKKGEEVVQKNLDILRGAALWMSKQHCSDKTLAKAEERDVQRLMIQSNEAVAMGAIASGCNFCSFYPMTPSTSIALNLIAKGKSVGLVAEQAEDEIAAVNMALGASFAGGRVLVPTSGGGFALMVEGVSLAGILEMPIVFALAQRPGPATGLPTRTEQGDLNLAVYAGHGDFPRAVFAPSNPEEAFYLTRLSFELAEAFQTPMFVLTDQYLADSYRAVDMFDLEGEPIELLLEPEEGAEYKRYTFTDDGISPRAIPGYSKALVKVDSDEHDESGHIDESSENRLAMVEKRQAKTDILKEEFIPPAFYGEEDGPDLLLVTWGSSCGPALEAMAKLKKQDYDVAVLNFMQVYPLNEEAFLDILEAAGRVVMVEGNISGQFARLLRQETGFQVDDVIRRFDGFPFTAEYILEAVYDIL
ncbi:MAG: 2-oxoacid:acceptor oxidoreductase subunit alpha [Desulfovibrio sp.]